MMMQIVVRDFVDFAEANVVACVVPGREDSTETDEHEHGKGVEAGREKAGNEEGG